MNDKNGGKKPIRLTVNNVTVESETNELTGAQLKALATIPMDYELFQVRGQNTVPIGNEELIQLHNNEQFRAIPAGTFGDDVASAEA